MSKRKTFASAAFLVILTILALLIPFFVNVDACGRRHHPHKPRHPPLGKTIIKHFVYPDGTPIGECLEVELWNTGLEPLMVGHTDSEGKVVFVGLPDQTYTIAWYWQGNYMEEEFQIDCSQIIWEFTNVVDYWTVSKTFYYDTVPPEPIVGLHVTMNGFEGYTDETGTVVFSNVKAGSYTIEWLWGGVTKTEAVEIGFQTPTPVELTNYLEPKSGGGKYLYLAEELG